MLNYIKLIRPVNLLIIILTQGMFRFLIVDPLFGLSGQQSALGLTDFVLLVLATILLAAGGYVINDVIDVSVDKHNKPAKQLIGEDISVKQARVFYIFLTLSGSLIGFLVAFRVDYWLLGFIFPLVALMLWEYSRDSQKQILIGNLLIAFMTSLVILVVFAFEFFAIRGNSLIYVEVMKQLPLLGWITFGYGIFAFLTTLLREIAKDAEDEKGDREGEYKTLVIVYGKGVVRIILQIITFITIVALGLFQYLLYTKGFNLVFWYLLLALQSLLFFVFYHEFSASSSKEFRFISNAYKLIMVAGILSMQLFYISF